jgi:hypothetical protein
MKILGKSVFEIEIERAGKRASLAAKETTVIFPNGF